MAEAELAHHQRRREAAARHAARALALAQQYRMPYEIGCAHLLLSVVGQPKSGTRPERAVAALRKQHQRLGDALLRELGTVWLYPIQPAGAGSERT